VNESPDLVWDAGIKPLEMKWNGLYRDSEFQISRANGVNASSARDMELSYLVRVKISVTEIYLLAQSGFVERPRHQLSGF